MTVHKANLLDREPMPGCLDRWSGDLDLCDFELDSEIEAVIVFRLSKYWLAWPAKNVQTVTEPKLIKKIPHKDTEALLGTVKIFGHFHLVVSLEYMLKIRSLEAFDSDGASLRRKAYPRFIMVKHKNNTIVFPVNDVEGIHYLIKTKIQPVVSGKAGKTVCFHARGMFDYGQKNVFYLDKTRVFDLVDSLL